MRKKKFFVSLALREILRILVDSLCENQLFTPAVFKQKFENKRIQSSQRNQLYIHISNEMECTSMKNQIKLGKDTDKLDK